jgi:AcrR family transcriptional regulator
MTLATDADDRRATLTRARVLEAAVTLADREGIEAVSMRRLGQELGIEAMSLYTHVKGKDDLLDGMTDLVVSAIPLASTGDDWKTVLRGTILGARAVMLRHPWAARVVETRPQPGPATLRYIESVAGILFAGGFSDGLAHHALHVLGSRILGFTQDLYDDTDTDADADAELIRQMVEAYPSVGRIAMTASHEGGLGGCDDDVEFAFGLDLILDGLERRLAG